MNGPGPRTMPGLRQLPILPNGQSATGFKCCEKAWLKLICAGRPVGTTSYDGRTTVLGRWLSGAPRGHPRRRGAPQSPIDLLLIAGVHSLPDAQRPPMQRAADRPTTHRAVGPVCSACPALCVCVRACVRACVCVCVCGRPAFQLIGVRCRPVAGRRVTTASCRSFCLEMRFAPAVPRASLTQRRGEGMLDCRCH